MDLTSCSESLSSYSNIGTTSFYMESLSTEFTKSGNTSDIAYLIRQLFPLDPNSTSFNVFRNFSVTSYLLFDNL
jgi:hypothetical protein